eukprot:TRINITY_DN9489_c0_g5_i1.p1 TRINITY_DN9489_c0_g5~~TRINITY_DN9489_c0_g5_i1.p1  ORF type:complete len:326 (+),score=60.26 TRINITY_DN9489_c0_g5_i1:74-1051(+)
MQFPNARKLLEKKMKERKYDSFLKYNIDEDEKFHQYVLSIDPNPSIANVLKYMKQYYKDNIDKNFDVDYDPDQEEEVNQPTEPEEVKENVKEPEVNVMKPVMKPLPWATKFQFMFFLLFLTTFPIGFLAKLYYHLIPLYLAFIIGLLKKHGFIKFNKDYWYGVASDDHFHNIIGVVIASLTRSGTISVWLPLLIRSVLFIAECIGMISRNGNALTKIANRYTSSIANSREAILKFKAEFDIYIGFYLVLMLAISWVSFTGVLFYWQSMQFKYVLVKNSKEAFDILAVQMDAIIENQGCPFPARITLKGLRKLGKFMANLVVPKKK